MKATMYIGLLSLVAILAIMAVVSGSPQVDETVPVDGYEYMRPDVNVTINFTSPMNVSSFTNNISFKSMEIGDSFNGFVLNSSKWSDIQSSYEYLDGDDLIIEGQGGPTLPRKIYSSSNMTGNGGLVLYVRADLNFESTTSALQGFGVRDSVSPNNEVMFYRPYSNIVALKTKKEGSGTTSLFTFSSWGGFHDYVLIWNDNYTAIYIDGVLKRTSTSNVPQLSTSMYVFLYGNYWSSTSCYFDYVSVFRDTNVSYNSSWSNGNTTLTLNPDSNLTLDMGYLIYVSGNVTNETGVSLDGDGDSNPEGSPTDDYFLGFFTYINPPHIVDTIPVANATGVPITSNIVIEFDMAMNKTELFNNIEISPYLNVDSSSFVLSGGDKILTINPIDNMDYSTTYTVNISGDLIGINGGLLDGNNNSYPESSPIDDYVFNFTTSVVPPVVSSTVPINASIDASIWTVVIVTFSKAMNTTSVEANFSISPNVSGSFNWTSDNKTVAFIPDTNLSLSTTYSVTINGTAKDFEDQGLDGNGNGTSDGSPSDDYSFSFTTEATQKPARVVETVPDDLDTDVDVDINIVFKFSKRMNESSTLANMVITPSTAGAYTWYFGQYLSFNPTGRLSFNTSYDFKVKGSAKDIGDMTLDGDGDGTSEGTPTDDYILDFDTELAPPIVTATSPTNGSIDVIDDTNIIVNFSKSMQPSSFVSRVFIYPSISWSPEWSDQNRSFTINPVSLGFSTTYTVTISGYVRDSEGTYFDGDGDGLSEGSPTDDYVFEFTVEAVPPQVNDTHPLDSAVDVPVTDSIYVNFTKSMNTSSVISGFSINPYYSGGFSWLDSNKTLIYDPTFPLQYSTSYTIRILGSARDSDGILLDGDGDFESNGTPNDDYVFTFTTTLIPKINSVSPNNGAVNVDEWGNIIVRFNKPMNTSDPHGWIDVSPAVLWNYGWSGNNLTIDPTPQLSFGTLYTVSISGDFEDYLGMTLDGNNNGLSEGEPTDNYSFSFRIVYATYVVSNDPLDSDVDVPVDTSVEIVFNNPMNTASVEANVSFVNFTAIWSSGNRKVTITPDSLLDHDTVYFVNLSGDILDSFGNLFDGDNDTVLEGEPTDNYSFSFTTALEPPQIDSVFPLDNSINVEIDINITINFTHSMNKSSVSNGLSVHPSLVHSSVWSCGNATLTLVPYPHLAWETEYTVTISGNVKDINGTRLDGDNDSVSEGSPVDNYVFSFTTRVEPTYPSFSDFYPMDGYSVYDDSINISISYSDPDGINISSVRIWVNGTEYTGSAIITTSQIILPWSDFTDLDTYNVSLYVEDTLGYGSWSNTSFVFYDSEYLAVVHNFRMFLYTFIGFAIVGVAFVVASRLFSGDLGLGGEMI